MAAIGAGDEAAQREVGADVLAGGNISDILKTLEDLLMGSERDQRLVMAFRGGDAPFGRLDIAGIDDAAEELAHALVADQAAGQILRPGGLALEEALDLVLRGKAAAGEALERLLGNGRERFVAHQHVALAGNALVAIADRSGEHGIAIHQPRLHAVQRLLCILAALVLGDGGEDIFVELAIGIVAQLDRGRFQNAACRCDCLAQVEVEADIARDTRQIVDHHHMGIAPIGLEEGEKLHQARTVGLAAGQVIEEDAHHVIAAIAGILPAARLLRFQAVAAARLRL
ncbi:MAG: hypothetical protein M9905_06165 [Rhizobiaceae bacterium]|nr:hypothetical protein [Rhizobiaceae bacterium]